MRGVLIGLVAMLVFMGCATTGPVQTGPGEFMVTRTAIGDTWSDGSRVLAGLYKSAGQHCSKKGLVVEKIEDEKANGRVFVRNASATLRFRCVADEPAVSSTAETVR